LCNKPIGKRSAPVVVGSFGYFFSVADVMVHFKPNALQLSALRHILRS
jgi:hypothetical protein